MKIDFQAKQKKFRTYREKHNQGQLRTIKLIAATIKLIVKNNSKNLSNSDIKYLCEKVYSKYDRIKHVRVRNMLSQEIVQNKINTALITFYSNILDETVARECLKIAIDTAKEKRDVPNLLKIAEKYENAANLTQKSSVTARTTETVDYSKIGKDGLPTSKVVKTLEISNITDQVAQDEHNDGANI